MTKDRDQQRVSSAYRDLAQESSPAELDRRILAAAERQGRSRYGIARAWMRPVAWAATIGLSLAILLEFTMFTDAQLSSAPQPTPATPSAERARRTTDVMRAKEADAIRQSAPQYAPTAAMAEEMEIALPTPCDDEARKAAQSWYACIEALRDQARQKEADAELAALREAFPDFEITPAR